MPKRRRVSTVRPRGADPIAPGEALMQVPDTNAEMMSVEDFRRVMETRGAFRDLVGHYTQVVIA